MKKKKLFQEVDLTHLLVLRPLSDFQSCSFTFMSNSVAQIKLVHNCLKLYLCHEVYLTLLKALT